jgi:hypothetical protein
MNRSFGTILYAGVVFLLLSVSAIAAQPGDVEIGLQLGGNGQSGERLIPVIQPYLGVYLNDAFSLGGSFVYESGSVESADYSVFGVDMVGRYNISMGKASNTTPFAEVGLRYISNKEESITIKYTSFLVGGGIRYRLIKNVFLNAKANYATGKLEGADLSAFSFSTGLSILLR